MDEKSIVIFGAGMLGIDFLFNLMKFPAYGDYKVFFIDNSKEKQGKEILGIPILRPEEIANIEYNRIYLAASGHENEQLKQLSSLGVPLHKVSSQLIERDKINCLYPIWGECAKASFLLNGTNEEYERKYDEIKKKYSNIRIFWIRIDAIGELVLTYFSIKDNPYGNVDKDLNVFMPFIQDRNTICNKELIQLIAADIYLPIGKELNMWIYIIMKYRNELDFSHEGYYFRHIFKCNKVDIGHETFQLKNDAKYNKCMELMGISCLTDDCEGDAYICIANRSNRYAEKSSGQKSDAVNDFRNFDFEDFNDTVFYLKSVGLKSVRMGRYEEPIRIDCDTFIDYAGNYYDEYMDLYISSKSSGFIISDNGMISFAMLFGKPCFMVNVSPISKARGGIQYTDADIYIPQKYYDYMNQRYLNLREIIELEQKIDAYGNFYDLLGIRLEKNTPEEIRLSSAEFVKRIHGEWEDGELDKKNLEKYYQIIDWAQNQYPADIVLPIRISTIYLRNNLDLIDC